MDTLVFDLSSRLASLQNRAIHRPVPTPTAARTLAIKPYSDQWLRNFARLPKKDDNICLGWSSVSVKGLYDRCWQALKRTESYWYAGSGAMEDIVQTSVAYVVGVQGKVRDSFASPEGKIRYLSVRNIVKRSTRQYRMAFGAVTETVRYANGVRLEKGEMAPIGATIETQREMVNREAPRRFGDVTPEPVWEASGLTDGEFAQAMIGLGLDTDTIETLTRAMIAGTQARQGKVGVKMNESASLVRGLIALGHNPNTAANLVWRIKRKAEQTRME